MKKSAFAGMADTTAGARPLNKLAMDKSFGFECFDIDDDDDGDDDDDCVVVVVVVVKETDDDDGMACSLVLIVSNGNVNALDNARDAPARAPEIAYVSTLDPDMPHMPAPWSCTWDNSCIN